MIFNGLIWSDKKSAGGEPETFIIYDELSSPGADDYIIDADYPIDLSRRSSKNEDGNLPLKKSSPRHTGELCPNSPNCPIARQKIKVDNKARFRYQVGYWFRLIDASICGASTEADTQFSIFDSSALKKQCLIFKAQFAVEEGLFQKGGQQAVLAYISDISPNVLNWFAKRGYQIKVGVIADTAVVLVCEQGKLIFEDTYCEPGKPDKDHTDTSLPSCEITMSEIEISEICN